ncbi:hypothetical protein NHX12_032741 [Muraenolepis orangiensis]|uniref:Uncharacterized protein n=1 Tax=Muraenolepis orangiensis TaxID=630683 RepID=A0A9Q0I107_9TELE|nr:hypothetical protein NHX12_032741 [Muraenolepis orangiensis]
MAGLPEGKEEEEEEEEVVVVRRHVSPSTAKSHVKQMQAVGNSRKPHHQELAVAVARSLVEAVARSLAVAVAVAMPLAVTMLVVVVVTRPLAVSVAMSLAVVVARPVVVVGSQVASGGQVGGGGGSQVASAGQVASARGQLKKGRVRANSETDVKKEPSSGGAKGPHVEKRIPSGGKRELSTAKKAERDWPRTETGGMATKVSVKRTAKELPSLSKPLPGSKPNGKAKNVHFVAK